MSAVTIEPFLPSSSARFLSVAGNYSVVLLLLLLQLSQGSSLNYCAEFRHVSNANIYVCSILFYSILFYTSLYTDVGPGAKDVCLERTVPRSAWTIELI